LTASLAVSYAAAWRALHRQPKWDQMLRRLLKPNKTGLLAAGLLLLSLLWHLPLRVVAPCEVVPKDPWVVTAPLNGVISEVLVQPGQDVQPGDLLFTYDKRTAQEELKVARQQVEIIRSGLNRAKLQAFVDPKSRAEVGMLEYRLEQEETRLQMAEYTVGKLEVSAETKGRVVLDDPHRWRGRPVALGEMVLMIVNPQSNKVRIWLPETDNVDFDRDHLPKVVLNAFPEKEQKARLTYVAQNVVTNPEGVASVTAEARWETEQPEMRIGLKGMAVLYGRQVPLAYWLLRKPLAHARNLLGW
jgi:multidrug resistance efflux pump